uniref:Uncharacterized protein n=1 Tax=Setaria italica TaxID=4555 RepID=K3Y3T5_SETIT
MSHNDVPVTNYYHFRRAILQLIFGLVRFGTNSLIFGSSCKSCLVLLGALQKMPVNWDWAPKSADQRQNRC